MGHKGKWPTKVADGTENRVGERREARREAQREADVADGTEDHEVHEECRTWWEWHEVCQIAREWGLVPYDILVRDKNQDGRWAANLQVMLYNVTENSLRRAKANAARYQ